jgi:hypothetical protein
MLCHRDASYRLSPRFEETFMAFHRDEHLSKPEIVNACV